MTITELIVSVLAVLATILRYIPSTKSISFPVFIIYMFGLILVALVFFVVRIVKDKVVDWSQILFVVLWLALALIFVHDAGGWSAVFP